MLKAHSQNLSVFRLASPSSPFASPGSPLRSRLKAAEQPEVRPPELEALMSSDALNATEAW